MSKKLYEDLGVTEDATTDEIKAAYKRKCQKLHPDKNGGKPSDKFLAVQDAYNTLKDEEARARYDRTGDAKDGPIVTDMQWARSHILQMAFAIVDQVPDPAAVDFIDTMRQFVNKDLAKAGSERSKAVKRQEKLKTTLERFSIDEGDNFVSAAMQHEINNIEQKIIDGDKLIKKFDLVTDLLDHLSYRQEKQPDGMSMFGSNTWHTVATSTTA